MILKATPAGKKLRRQALCIALVIPNVALGVETQEPPPPADLATQLLNQLPNLEGLRQRNVDLNEDGAPDLVYHIQGDTVSFVQSDLNHDGRFDSLLWLNVDGSRRFEQLDFDFDGRYDWIDVYDNGERTTAHADTDFDGVTNVTFHYLQGKLVETVRR